MSFDVKMGKIHHRDTKKKSDLRFQKTEDGGIGRIGEIGRVGGMGKIRGQISEDRRKEGGPVGGGGGRRHEALGNRQ
jgi:hypothetical protein